MPKDLLQHLGGWQLDLVLSGKDSFGEMALIIFPLIFLVGEKKKTQI